MKFLANLSINFALTKPIAEQLANLDLLMAELATRGISITSANVSPRSVASSKPDTIGENESAWLAFSKRGRMNMKDKSLSREAQAKIYLEEKGLTVPNPDCETIETENTDDESVQDDSDDIDSDSDDIDIFIPKL